MAVIFRNSKTVVFFVNLKKKKTLHKEGKTRGKRSCSKRKKAFQVSFFSLVINDEYYPWIKLTLSVCLSEGLFTWREEGPVTRKILEGGTTLRWVYTQKFRSVWCPNIEGSKRN